MGFAKENDLDTIKEQQDIDNVDDESIKFNIPIEYKQLTKSEFDQILTDDGAQAFSDRFEFHNAFRIHITGPVNNDTIVRFRLNLSSFNQLVIGKSQNTTDNKTAKIQFCENDGFVFDASNTNTWLNILEPYHVNDDYFFVTLSAIAQNEEPIELDIWVCQTIKVRDSVVGYYYDEANGASITIQAYDIIDAHSSVAINNQDIDRIGLDQLLSDEGVDDFKHLFTQKHIYRIHLNGPTNLYSYGSLSKLNFNQNVPVLVGKVTKIYSNSHDYVKIGPSSVDLYNFNTEEYYIWTDFTQLCGENSMYVLLVEDDISHSRPNFIFWIGLDESLGSYLNHEQFRNGLTRIYIDGWHLVSDQQYASTMDFGFDPISQNELKSMLNDDDAGDFISIMDKPYLYNIELINGIDTDKPVKMKMGLDLAPVSAIGKGSGNTTPQAAIGDAINNQYNVDMENWEDLTSICNNDTLFTILSNNSGSQKASQLSLWFGFDDPPGHELFYENLDGYFLPDIINVNAYRVVEKQPITLIGVEDSLNYAFEYLQEGDNYYTDRQYSIQSIPEELKGLVWLKTSYNEFNGSSDSLLAVNIKASGTVYIAYINPEWYLPGWMSKDFVLTSYKIYLSETSSYFPVYKKEVTPGELILGGNQDESYRCPYVVLFEIPEGLPPVADFKYQRKSGSEPLTMQFTDQSTGFIENWAWDFGDGESSTEQNPEHIYAVADTYHVILTISNAVGVDSKTDTVIVTYTVPVAAFHADIKSGDKPLTVSFTDESPGMVDTWSWDFGDGSTSTEQHPVHVYTSADSFDVSLTVSGPGGSDQVVKEDYIVVVEPVPVAQFTADITEGSVPLTVQFSDTSSGVITSWLWDFGDGSSSTDQNPQHVYSKVDTYTVALTVTGPGGSANLVKTDYISVQFPTGIAGLSEQPTSFALYGNYPNPFNPTTNITFDVPAAQHVKVSIYNVNGSLVETLVDEHKSPGRYTINWQAGHHSSGTYFIRMVTEGYSKIQKCILLK